MKTTFLEYYKIILPKVSFDETLLNKEFKKALNTLNNIEGLQLIKWFESKFKLPNIDMKTPGLNKSLT